MALICQRFNSLSFIIQKIDLDFSTCLLNLQRLEGLDNYSFVWAIMDTAYLSFWQNRIFFRSVFEFLAQPCFIRSFSRVWIRSTTHPRRMRGETEMEAESTKKMHKDDREKRQKIIIKFRQFDNYQGRDSNKEAPFSSLLLIASDFHISHWNFTQS